MTTQMDGSLTIQINPEIKQQAQQIFSDLGLDMATAINVFLRQAVLFKGFPFDVQLKEPNQETLEALQEVRQMKTNPSVGKVYADVDEMIKELLG